MNMDNNNIDMDLDWLINQKKLSDPIDEKYIKEKINSITIHLSSTNISGICGIRRDVLRLP